MSLTLKRNYSKFMTEQQISVCIMWFQNGTHDAHATKDIAIW